MDANDIGLSSSLNLPAASSQQHHICPVCSHNSSSQAALICHLTTKHNERLVAVCKVCHQLFPSDAISSHVLTCKGSYACPYCRSTFALPSYLQRHITRRHMASARCTCELCGKSFSSSNALMAHSRLHEGRFPYNCDFCIAKFAQKNELKLHMDSHHAYIELNEKPKPFSCRTCGRGFLFMVSLQQHRLQHNKISPKKSLSCKVCKKLFHHQSELERHGIIHLKSSPYQCPFCPRAFTRPSILKTHILRHTDPGILTCRYCSRTYASRSYLLQHIEKHEVEMQTPSVSSLSTTSLTEFESNTLSDYETSTNLHESSNKVWEEPMFMNFDGIQILPPNVNYLHALLYGQNV